MVVAFRRELEQFFRQLRQEQQQASLSISSNVRGATIRLNGEAVGTTPLEDLRVVPGNYTIEVTKQGFSTWEAEMTLDERARMTLRAPLQRQRQPEPEPEPAASLPDPGAPREPRDTIVEIDPPPRDDVNWGGWSLVTIGGVALAGSGVMALLMNGVEQEMRQKFDDGTLTPSERDQLQERGESYELSHRLLLGVGAAGVVVGGLWLLLDGGSGSGDEEAARPRLELRAGPAGISGAVRF